MGRRYTLTCAAAFTGTKPGPTAVRNCAPCIAKTTIFLFQDCCQKYALRARERWRAARIAAISILSERKCDFLKRNGGHSRKKRLRYNPSSELHIGGPRRLSHRSRWRCAGCASGLGLPFYEKKRCSARPEKIVSDMTRIGGRMLNFEEFGDKIKAPRAPGSPASLLEAADERKQKSIPRA